MRTNLRHDHLQSPDVMTGPITYQPDHLSIDVLAPEQFITAHDWTHDRDGNVNPVLQARFSIGDDEFDAFAKPFTPGDRYDATLILNEVTGWLLARASGLPVPERAFFAQLNMAELPPYPGASSLPQPDADGRILCFATQAVSNTAVRTLFPTDLLAKEQAAWPRCDETIAFDEAIANPDRHLFNLLRRNASDFVLIDHGFLLRRDPPAYPEHWDDGVLPTMTSAALANILHSNAYTWAGRTSPTVCIPAYEAGHSFIGRIQPLVRRAMFEISFWCSKLLPGRSAQWLDFLYSRIEQAHLSPLLLQRFGLLSIPP